MTKEELIRAWDKICYCCTDSAAYPIKELAMIARVLIAYEDKQAITDKTIDKYRWHDMLKDPTDLPCDMDNVQICWVGGSYYWYDSMFWDADRGVFSIYGKTEYEVIHPIIGDKRYSMYGEAIAWREIEPFEVSE